MANLNNKAFCEQRRALALEAIKRNPEAPARTIARGLHAKHPTFFPTVENARNTVRYVFGNHGGVHRVEASDKSLFRAPRVAGAVSPLPVSKAQSWEPYEIKAERTLVLNDVHVPYHDAEALEAALSWADKWNPNCILLNGDILDFYSISRFTTNPEERDLPGEVSAAFDFLKHLQTRFPSSKLVYKLGNHEERWENWIANNAEQLWSLPHSKLEFVLTNRVQEAKVDIALTGIDFVRDGRPIKIGNLTILHGHELGKGGGVNVARWVQLKTNECVAVGHLHRTSEHNETSMLHRLISNWSIGCLCDLRRPYARVNKWNHGFFAVTLENDDGDFKPQNFRYHNGKILGG